MSIIPPDKAKKQRVRLSILCTKVFGMPGWMVCAILWRFLNSPGEVESFCRDFHIVNHMPDTYEQIGMAMKAWFPDGISSVEETKREV